eukprot:CAMPEP_0119355816 /NCGR_PEP_ID=MMETSP1334-20130426/4607_1 /TAXON_ID=127549 /ORGANISM="Calcidiscus leptoporus, Strain RCC1130" /LENGTH=77 /DNA_ID=CAMNT_0007369741 /DNA_START=104 /DNA_END=334 /DNA_ORIENTATION=+
MSDLFRMNSLRMNSLSDSSACPSELGAASRAPPRRASRPVVLEYSTGSEPSTGAVSQALGEPWAGARTRARARARAR